MNGYIKLYRSLTEWEWFNDQNTLQVWIYCLCKANWKDKRFRGVDVPRGTFIASYATIAKACKLTTSQVRTALQHLETSGEISRQIASKWQAITVEKYDLYQDERLENRKQDSRQVAGKSQANRRQIATTEERKKERKEIKQESSNIPPAPTGKKLRERLRAKGITCEPMTIADVLNNIKVGS